VVDVRLICREALEQHSSGIIIAHNHPSGQLLPSEQDKQITRKLKEGLKLFDISLLDHLIIGDQRYLSFSDEGLL
jgi:DNA repair protein RadC